MFLAGTEHLSGFTALGHQVGVLGVSASLENFSSHRNRVCLFVFSSTTVSTRTIPNLTPECMNQKLSQHGPASVAQ